MLERDFSRFGRAPVDYDSDSGYGNDIKLNSFLELNANTERHIVCVSPTRKTVDAQIIESWFELASPINQEFVRLIFSADSEEAELPYNTAVIAVLHHDYLRSLKYLFIMDDLHLPSKNTLLKLIEAMVRAEKAGENLWGVSAVSSGTDFLPGFALYRMELFRKLKWPWFSPDFDFQEKCLEMGFPVKAQPDAGVKSLQKVLHRGHV
jgi:hypothetical protein